MSGYTMTQLEELYCLPATVTNNTFTTQRVISAPAAADHAIVPAKFWSATNPNRALLIKGAGTMANAATGATFANVLALDTAQGTLLAGGTIFSIPAIAPTASTTIPFDFEIWVTAQALGPGATTLQCNGTYNQAVAASSTTLVATNLSSMISTSLTALNNEAQMFLELFSTCSSSNASNTISLQQLHLFGLN